MPAVTPTNILALPAVTAPPDGVNRPVHKLVTACFARNTRAEIAQALEDFNAGPMGTIPVLHGTT